MGDQRKGLTLLFMGLVAMLMIAGCSSDSPSSSSPLIEKTNDYLTSLAETQLQLSGRVATIDYDSRTLTIAGLTDLIQADGGCYIFTVSGGVETPLGFADIAVGDSVQVCGDYSDIVTFLANRIRVYEENTCPEYDVFFRDTITTIDYANGAFTTANQSVTVTVDANTLIWGRIGLGNSQGETGELLPSGGETAVDTKDRNYTDIIYVFSDLEAGDIVEVRGFVIDENTVLAAVIKVANTQDVKSTTFTATIETIDCNTRVVTFEDDGLFGTVCPGALLLDSDGSALTLCDFLPGDYVAVKGLPQDDGSLKICEMILQ